MNRTAAAGIGAAVLAAGVLAFANSQGSPSPASAGSTGDAPSTTATAPAPTPSPTGAAADGASRTPNLDADRSPQTRAGTAVAAVNALPVKGRAPMTGYERDLFGRGWIDVDRNGCDTRNDMLRSTLSARRTSGTCTVLAGTLNDPYTRTTLRFEYGGVSEVDIDHVVALGDAWQKGATGWPFAKRVAFANDPLNLQPADAAANRQKGDADAATWLPPNQAYRCTYVARQAAVKTKYRLWVTAAERDAMLRVLRPCPGQELPAPGPQPTIAANTGGQAPAEPASAPTRQSVGAARADGSTDPRLGTCGAAVAAGYGPYRRGADPEYDWYIDADKDGTVCE